jgi:L-histidine N-alpha-methyltransferase
MELQIDVYETADPARELEEIRAGLLRTPRETDPKYFYDDLGSALFESICELPEYYQTRTEHALLQSIAPGIVERTGIAELVELGAGNASKTRVLLDAMADAGALQLYVPFDFSAGILRRVAGELVAEYPGLRVHGVVADFTETMYEIPAGVDERLVAFLGGTIGNFTPADAARFLRRLAARMRRGDWLLLGTDLIKDVRRLEAAYDDAAGVTAEFNKNVLRVLNARLGGDFDPDRFRHRAFYDRRRHWIEMRLVSTAAQRVHLPVIDLELQLGRGEEIRTEISTKYDRSRAGALLENGGFDLVEWHTDPESLFALSLARRR